MEHFRGGFSAYVRAHLHENKLTAAYICMIYIRIVLQYQMRVSVHCAVGTPFLNTLEIIQFDLDGSSVSE